MTKQQQVIDYLTSNVLLGGEVNTYWINSVCLAMDVSLSTVRRALSTMRRQGILSDRKLGRTYLVPERFVDLVAADEYGFVVMTDARYDELCRRFVCDRRTLWYCISEAEHRGMIYGQPTGIGMMYRLQ